MLTEKDYCDYDTCVALKELGYPTKMTFIGEQATIEIPINSGLIQLYEAHKFLREKGLHIEIDRVGYGWLVSVVETKNNLCLDVKKCQSYEEALSEGVKCAVKILKGE